MNKKNSLIMLKDQYLFVIDVAAKLGFKEVSNLTPTVIAIEVRFPLPM